MGEPKIMTRAATRIRFRNVDMDFNLTWVLGVADLFGWSHGEVMFVASRIKDGNPASWRREFRKEGEHLLVRAANAKSLGNLSSAGQAQLGACFSFRAALQYCDPREEEFKPVMEAMEQSFQNAVQDLRIPIKAVEVPFEASSLPGYFLRIDNQPRPTVVMVGGGDTFREDLFSFAGYAGWKRDYNVLMVDLPGQGKTPERGLYFRPDGQHAICAVLDWLQSEIGEQAADVALFGVSGGGYFTAQTVVADARPKAWIASTPIIDMARLFSSEMAVVLRTPPWIIRGLEFLLGRSQSGLAISLRKYAWQFGTPDFAAAVHGVLERSVPVQAATVSVPSLFLMGEAESPELKRQTRVLADELQQRGVDVTVREFTAADGADAHCQVNNLRLLHAVVFDWLDGVFDRGLALTRLDPRLLC